MTTPKPLRALLVGCGRMGRNQARLVSEHPDFELVGVCDVRQDSAAAVAEELGVACYTELRAALATTRPDTVSICTDNATHARVALAAAATEGVRGLYCEKPMAINLGQARAMVTACREAGVVLVVNHQRRVGEDLWRMKQLIEEGVLGEVTVARGNCAGDMLSDGTHLVDSLLWICGDPQPVSVVGQVHRTIDDDMIERARKQSERSGQTIEPGTRYGHPVENGALALVELSSGVRMELFCGDLREPQTAYQEYLITGTKGRLWRTGDQLRPNLFLQIAETGDRETGVVDWCKTAVPAPSGEGQWRALRVEDSGGGQSMWRAYARFADSVRTGAPHPMDGDHALRGFEVLMAVYESARLRKRIRIPLEQERFPLELIIEDECTGAP